MESNKQNMVGGRLMEKFIFIHGSASGQSSLPLNSASSQLCNEISKWYFEERESRTIGTSALCPMFVELYKGKDGKRYCLYSFVLNECFGPAPDYRPGQYFAITMALQDYYSLHPSSIYYVLSGAYDQLIRNKIIAEEVVANDKKYHNVYRISQFRDKKNELIDFQNKISNFFDQDCLAFCKPLPESVKFPTPWNGKNMTKIVNNVVEGLPWNGETIHLSECDSGASADRLMKEGRIYVSDKAPLSSDIVQKLSKEKDELVEKNKELQKKANNPVPNPKDQREINTLKTKVQNLNAQVETANSRNEQLQKKNNELVDTFNNLDGLLIKYKENTNKQLGVITNNVSQKVKDGKDWRRLIKTLLLIIILILTLGCLVLNICFFRGISSKFEEINSQIDSIGLKVDMLGAKVDAFEKVGREMTQVETQTAEDTSSVSQKKGQEPDYGLAVTDHKGNSITYVKYGQKIIASVTKPEKNLDFTLHGVEKTGSIISNNSVELKVTLQSGEIAIGYGLKGENNRSKRQIIKLNVAKNQLQQ